MNHKPKVNGKVEAGGYVQVEIKRLDGSIWRSPWFKNLTVSAGKAQLALLAGDASATPFTFLGVGTSSTAPAAGNTALGAEITDTGLARAAATVSRVTTNVANDTLRLVKTWTATGTKAIEECGIFNASSAGTMLGRALTGTKNVVNGEQFTVTYDTVFA